MNTNKEFIKLNFKEKGYFYDEEFFYDSAKRIINSKPGFNDLMKVHPEMDGTKLSKEEYDKLLEEQFKYNCNWSICKNIYEKIKTWNTSVNEYSYYTHSLIDETAKDLPKKLYQNIEEWINDEPFTDVMYKDITLNEILKKMHYDRCSDMSVKVRFMLYAFTDIARYANGTYENKYCVLREAFDQTHVM